MSFMQNTYHRVLPFCYFDIRVSAEALKAFILRKKGVIERPKTLGEHLRNRRLALALRQEDVAERFGTMREVYERWERDEREPVVSVWPLIVTFLGYYPGSQASPADLTLMARRTLGLEQKMLAQKVGVIHQRLRRWEHGSEVPSPSEYSRLQTLLSEAPGVAC
ncbi:MAG: helix-turn-helix domain-containing protein [Verrucomicrobiaceae bacterium]|nr:helix-turn-helix domain-containing protein [Verrucomicrobiaceae bacterium]